MLVNCATVKCHTSGPNMLTPSCSPSPPPRPPRPAVGIVRVRYRHHYFFIFLFLCSKILFIYYHYYFLLFYYAIMLLSYCFIFAAHMTIASQAAPCLSPSPATTLTGMLLQFDYFIKNDFGLLLFWSGCHATKTRDVVNWFCFNFNEYKYQGENNKRK